MGISNRTFAFALDRCALASAAQEGTVFYGRSSGGLPPWCGAGSHDALVAVRWPSLPGLESHQTAQVIRRGA
uniref:Uncharacterized protein n=1 Tax=Oryza punctata TaxID=4537 RepID=A0A0E0LEL9_ORYPU